MIPAALAHIMLETLHVDKHVYSEKAFVTGHEDGEVSLALARKKDGLEGSALRSFPPCTRQMCDSHRSQAQNWKVSPDSAAHGK